MTLLVNEGGAFAPTRKYHLVTPPPFVPGAQYQPALRIPALCGALPSCSWNHRVSDRDEFERLVPERICKRCRKLDDARFYSGRSKEMNDAGSAVREPERTP